METWGGLRMPKDVYRAGDHVLAGHGGRGPGRARSGGELTGSAACLFVKPRGEVPVDTTTMSTGTDPDLPGWC